jgi:hypothetical protein
MQKIPNLNIYIGTKEEYRMALSQGMKIVCALNRANGFVTHQSQVDGVAEMMKVMMF